MGKPLLFISDGLNEINLLDPKAITINGWKMKLPQLKGGGIYSDSALADGRELVIEAYDNVVEEMPLYINGRDPDQIGAAQHVFFDLMRTLRGYFTRSERESTPVYLGFRPKDQTNIQYALLKNYSLEQNTEAFGHEFKGSLFKPSVMAGTLFLEREPAWREFPPGTISAAETLVYSLAPNDTVQWIANFRSGSFGELSDIYNYDSSLAAFSVNLVANASFDLFSVAGSVPAVGDIVYFGRDTRKPVNFILKLSTYFVGTATFVWEYYNGAWVTASDLYDATFGNELKEAGNIWETGWNEYPVFIPGWSNWVANAINGVTRYWVRLRITGVTLWTTSPHQGNSQAVFTPRDPSVDLPAGALAGDTEALLALQIMNPGDTQDNINRVIIGAKTRGLTNFVSHLNADSSAGANPVFIQTNSYTDTTLITDLGAPTSRSCLCTFASDISMVTRVQWRFSAAYGDTALNDWCGTYQVFAHVQQVGGAVGAVSLRFLTATVQAAGIGGIYPKVINETKKLRAVATGVELVDLGRVTLPPGRISSYESMRDVCLVLQASATSATPDLYIYDLVLMPIDEWAIMLNDPIFNATQNVSSLNSGRYVEVDGGLIAQRAVVKLRQYAASGIDLPSIDESWEMRSQPPKFINAGTIRLFFLFAGYEANFGTPPILGDFELMAAVRIYACNRWLSLRGDE